VERTKATRNRGAAPIGLTEVDIKIGLLRRGKAQVEIARALDVSVASVNMVIKGRMRSRKIEEYLKRVILGEVAA
jgi:DNA-binding CsgD family transcriptional regulator